MNSLTESPTDHHVPPAFPGSVTVISEAAPLIPPSHQHRTTGALPHHRSRSSLSFSDDPKTRRKEFAGLALMALSALAFSFMSLFVKIAYPDFQSFEIVLARSVVQLVLGLAACAVLGVSPLGTKGIRRWLIMRGLAGGVGLALFFYSLTKLPLADTTVLFFLGPTMTTLLAHFLYSEHFTPLDLLLTCFCALGVVFIAHPSSIFADTPNPEDSLAIYAALIGSLMSAVAYVTARKVGRATHFMVHVVYFGAVSSVLSAAGMYLWQGGIVVPVKMEQWIVLAAVGGCAFVGQCLLNMGLHLAPPGLSTILRMTDVALAFLLSTLILEDPAPVHTIAGAVLITVCTTAMGLHRWIGQVSNTHAAAQATRRESARERETRPAVRRHSNVVGVYGSVGRSGKFGKGKEGPPDRQGSTVSVLKMPPEPEERRRNRKAKREKERREKAEREERERTEGEQKCEGEIGDIGSREAQEVGQEGRRGMQERTKERRDSGHSEAEGVEW